MLLATLSDIGLFCVSKHPHSGCPRYREYSDPLSVFLYRSLCLRATEDLFEINAI